MLRTGESDVIKNEGVGSVRIRKIRNRILDTELIIKIKFIVMH